MMKLILINVLMVGIFAASAFSVTAKGKKHEPETELPGRSETNVVITIKDKGEYTVTYPAYPYVDTNGYVTILPGENHIIEFDVKDGQPVNPKWVKKRTKGKDAIELKFSNDGEMAMLIRRNKASKIITMKCRHQVANKKGMYQTGINPIEPGMSSYDSWSASVVSLVLFDFTFWDDYDKAFKHER